MGDGLDSISTIFLLKPDGALLLQLRDNIPTITRPGYWVIPGGHCEANERYDDCARREFLEETAYQCEEIEYIDTVMEDVNGYQYWLHMYWALYDGNQQIKCLEGQELRFIDKADAHKYLKIDVLLKYWDVAIKRLQIKYPGISFVGG